MKLLEEIGAAYDAGRLVPFIGAGMSRPVCRDWPGLIVALERLARISGELHPAGSPDDAAYLRRAARALDQLRFGRGMPTAEIVRRTLLESRPDRPPPQTRALADLDWPLVISTNYDDLYPAAVHQKALGTRSFRRSDSEDVERQMSVVQVAGRSSTDCHRILSSLSHPAPPMLWAIQGYLGGQALIDTGSDLLSDSPDLVYREWMRPCGSADRAELDRMQNDIVVGHADYRRVAARSEGFRRTFAEVFRNRSLLFLGSGLADRYLLDLFSQVIELHGPGPRPHFAIAARGTLDPEFLRHNYGIWVHEIAHHREVPVLLGQLARREPQQVRRIQVSTRPRASSPKPGVLSIVTSDLPETIRPTQGVVLSGGGSRSWVRVSGRSVEFLRRSGLVELARGADRRAVGQLFAPVPGCEFLYGLKQPGPGGGPLVLVARARLDSGSELARTIRPLPAAGRPDRAGSGESKGRLWRDLRVTAFALEEALDAANAAGKTELLSTLLAAGDLRTAPPSYVLIEMIRSWARSSSRARVDLTIHVTDEQVIADLHSHRIDVQRLLQSNADTIEFWLETVGSDGTTNRSLMIEPADRPVHELTREFGITGGGWEVTVEPVPCLEWVPWSHDEILARVTSAGDGILTLERLGVLHSSTMRLTQAARLGRGTAT